MSSEFQNLILRRLAFRESKSSRVLSIGRPNLGLPISVNLSKVHSDESRSRNRIDSSPRCTGDSYDLSKRFEGNEAGSLPPDIQRRARASRQGETTREAVGYD